jgi:hypothetical protein
MALEFLRKFGKPKHLMTIQRAFGSVEQVTVNLYFTDAREIDQLYKNADVALNRK